MHEKEQLNSGMGCLLTILSGGLFLPFWVFYSVLILPFRPYRCTQCGTGSGSGLFVMAIVLGGIMLFVIVPKFRGDPIPEPAPVAVAPPAPAHREKPAPQEAVDLDGLRQAVAQAEARREKPEPAAPDVQPDVVAPDVSNEPPPPPVMTEKQLKTAQSRIRLSRQAIDMDTAGALQKKWLTEIVTEFPDPAEAEEAAELLKKIK